MLEYLKLENVGPADGMEVEFAPRVNLITGDKRSREELFARYCLVGC